MDPVATPRRIFRLHVALVDIDPPIWRELEVAAELTLFDLHNVLQHAFGWEGLHLWCFDIAGISYAEEEYDGLEHSDRALASLIPGPGTRFSYRYDFGDGWVHEVVVRSDETKVGRDAACLSGARAGPPENCGGPPGYARLVKALADSSHPDHAVLENWCGPFDPEAFDRTAVDASLGEVFDDPDSRLNEQVDELLELLGEKHLAEGVREEVLADGPNLVPALIEILADPDFHDEYGPGGGWAPIHAVTLLVDLGASEAIDTMLDVLEDTGWMNIIHDRIVLDLPRLGAAVVEPALARLMDADSDNRGALLAILARTGVRDDRIYRHLVANLDDDPDLAAADLADYGDPAALPLILERFDAVVPAPKTGRLLIELADAVEVLGGRLTEAQQNKLELGCSLHRARFLPPPPVRRNKIGRNEPCHCGSGKKYKHCHLKADKPRATLH